MRQYMEDIGHYEFGKLHRPIAFPGLDDLISKWEPTMINYWLAYWIAAFEYVAAHRELVIPVSYEQTCSAAGTELSKICEQLDVEHEGLVNSIARSFQSPPPKRVDATTVDGTLRDHARELHRELIKI